MYALLRLIIWRRFTNVGRRIGLVQVSRKAADELQNELRIIGADITADAPALYSRDETRIVYRIKDSDYIPHLLAVCEREKWIA